MTIMGIRTPQGVYCDFCDGFIKWDNEINESQFRFDDEQDPNRCALCCKWICGYHKNEIVLTGKNFGEQMIVCPNCSKEMRSDFKEKYKIKNPYIDEVQE